jgi:hypothetical protein
MVIWRESRKVLGNLASWVAEVRCRRLQGWGGGTDTCQALVQVLA